MGVTNQPLPNLNPMINPNKIIEKPFLVNWAMKAIQ
jgi:hypothetical protein